MMIDKSTKLYQVSYEIRGPIAEEADRMAARGIDVIKLNSGNPAPFGFTAPSAVIRDLIGNLSLSQGYSHAKGLWEARTAIAAYCRLKDIPDVTPEDIFTGNGVSELIGLSMQALLNEGDEILIPAPDYPLWTAAARLAGGTVVHYLCDEQSDWLPDLVDLEKKITSRTKALVIINPNNPTGALYPKEVLLAMTRLAREHGLVIFSDEIYDRLVMDDLPHTATAALAPDLFIVTFNGLSKSHQVAGFRCGWMCVSGNKAAARGYIDGLNQLASMRLCSNVLSQSIIPAALAEHDVSRALYRPGGRIYQQRDYVAKALNAIPGITAVKPKAAFYIFPRIDLSQFRIVDDEAFVLDFLREHHILLTHGQGYHWPSPDHFRLIYLPQMAELQTVMERLALFLDTRRRLSSTACARTKAGNSGGIGGLGGGPTLGGAASQT